MLGPLATQFIERYPGDAARILEEAEPEVVAEVLGAIPAQAGAALLRAMSPHTTAASLSSLDTGAAAEVVAHLPLELAAALALRLDTTTRGALLNALPGRVSVPLRLMLRFPPGSVGSLIDPRVATVRSSSWRLPSWSRSSRASPSRPWRRCGSAFPPMSEGGCSPP